MINKTWKTKVATFLSAQTISLLGSSLVQYAIIWTITLETSSGLMLTFATLCGFLPQVLISIFAGALIDRFDRKKCIMIADGCIAISTLLLILVFLAGYKRIEFLFVILAIRSLGTGIQTPSVQSVIPQLVPKSHYMKVNGIQSTLSSMTMLLSPAMSGVILSYAPFEIILSIDVITALIGISITSFVQIPQLVKEEVQLSYFDQIQEGFSYLRKNHFLVQLLIYQLIILVLISPSAFLTPLLISRSYGGEVMKLSLSEMAYSLGMVGGGVLISCWQGFKNRLLTTWISGMFYACCMIGIGIAPTFIIYMVCNCLIGITSPCYNTPMTVMIQESVEEKMMGRVFSFLQITTSCALPLGMVIFGPLGDKLPVQFLFIINGILVFFVSFVMLLFQNRNRKY